MPSGDRIEPSDARNLIGRLADCRIIINDGNTSRHHAEIHRPAAGS
jgi:pSer/pThr/pTyr-binding forkhead associated (FHA) protein